MVNQCNKFEIFRFSRYEAMNGSAKCRKLSGLGWLWDIQGHGQCYHSIESIYTTSYSTLIETMCLSFTVFEI